VVKEKEVKQFGDASRRTRRFANMGVEALDIQENVGILMYNTHKV
jgi:hypothetical protein